MSEERAERNQVFSAPPQVGPASAQQSSPPQQPQPKADFGIDIPNEVVPLPSAGLVYPPGTPLCNQEMVEIRPGTAREEDILTSPAYLKKGTIITELLKACLVNKAIDPLDMLVGDRTALMLAIRITMYGAEYDTEITCDQPDCEHTGERPFNLGELPIRRLAISPVVPNTNLFEFLLPYTKKKVHFKFLTGRDEEVITKTSQAQKKLGMNSDNTVTTNLLYSLVSVDGVEDRGRISAFAKAMPARDSLALRTYIRDNEPGIIMKQETACPKCGHSETVSMPLGVSFFWPSAQ